MVTTAKINKPKSINGRDLPAMSRTRKTHCREIAFAGEEVEIKADVVSRCELWVGVRKM